MGRSSRILPMRLSGGRTTQRSAGCESTYVSVPCTSSGFISRRDGRKRKVQAQMLDMSAATVDSLKAQLELGRYYLDNTLLVAPEDVRIVNLH